MSTCLSVIKRSMRMLGVLAAGREPSSEEAADGLECLQGFYTHLCVGGTFGRLTDVYVTEDYTASENERITADASATITVTIPDTITDDATGDERAPFDAATVVVAGANAQTYIYDAEQALWVPINGLTLTGEAPFSTRLGSGLCALLAAHMAGEQGVSVPPTVALMAGQGMSSLTQRPSAASPITSATYY